MIDESLSHLVPQHPINELDTHVAALTGNVWRLKLANRSHAGNP